jgi:hypothetical protein
MPYRDKSKRREWETSPEQREKAAERQETARERREALGSLAAVWQIHVRCGHWRFCGPKLKAQVLAREAEIRKLLAARARERVEVWVDGKKEKNFNHGLHG